MIKSECEKRVENQTARFKGVWHNQHKSILNLDVAEDGRVTGTFQPGLACAENVREFPVVGYAENGVIGFVVAFPGFASITSWTGQLANISEDGYAETLHSSWHMAIDVGNKAEKQLWKAMVTGSDSFVRVPGEITTGDLKMAASHPMWLKENLSNVYV